MNPTWLYVAVLYAVAVALARRAKVELPKRAAALFYALVLIFLFRPMTGPYTNVAPDVLKLMAPWTVAGFTKYNVTNFELQDVMLQLAPWAQQVHEQWRELHVPLWNPLVGSGMPMLANMQSAALSPLRILTIPLPLAYALTAEAAMKILIALTFMFLYCRRRYDILPSVIGAISFGFGTFISGWLHYPIGATATFLPAVLYAIDLLAEKLTFARFLFAASLGPLLLSQGHPESVAHIAFFATFYALFTAPRAWRRLAAAAIVSVLLAAPILMPFLEAVRHTTRYEELQRESHADATPFSDFPSLALLVHPRLYGEHPGMFWGPAVTEAVTGFCGILGIGAWFGLIARRRFRGKEIFFFVATAVLFLVLDDVPLISAPIRELFSMALNARLRLLFGFCLAVLAAALVHYLRREKERAPLIAAIAGAAGAIAFVMLKTQYPGPAEKHFALMTLIPSILVLIVTPVFRMRPIVITAAVFIEMFAASHAWNTVTRGTDLYPRTPIINALLARRTAEPYRIVGIGAPLFPNTNAIFGFEDVRVHDPMSNARYVDLLRKTRDWDPNAYYEKWNDPDSPLLDFLNVRWVLTEPRVDLPRYKLVYDGADGRIYENPHVKPRFFATDARVAITKARGDAYELRVDAPRETLVASSIAFWPGWYITHNGHALTPRLVHGAFLGFTVPAGQGVVRVRYAPLSFWGGVAVSLLTVAVAAIIRARV